MTPARNAERMRYIDALRAVAALLVVWLHAAGMFGRINPHAEPSGNWLAFVPDRIDVGHIGVVVFFLISGFVIPFSIRAETVAPASSFLIKRFFRIFPAYWLSVPLAAIANFWIWGTGFDAREVMINLAMLQDAFGVRPAAAVYWTLSVEMVFYALCVLLLLTGSLFRMRRVGALAFLLVVAFAAMLPMYGRMRPLMSESAVFWFLNLSVMFWGTLFRSWFDSAPSGRDRFGGLMLWGLLVAYVIAVPALSFASSGYMRNTMATYVIGFAIFLLGTLVVRIETRLTDWLGRISYSIYLFHTIVFISIEWWLLRQPEDSWWRAHALGTYAAIATLIALAVASLVYRCVERPGIRAGHRLAARWGAMSRPARADARA